MIFFKGVLLCASVCAGVFWASLFSCSTKCADVIIYGGTPAAFSAAVQAKRMGISAIIVSPDKRIGGLTTGGLGAD